ncbi:uncharacterized protein C8Q71DRAFT_173179 [Rhodofomes roseus]|uniref:Uncharacterized protein n=1 Tax=Rhodofomes roseus TaxID=34475 RepID=A0ABQ8K8W4_9APHY|nr:uncharacterized protein C8Q71DRAFT_173179 [Rhodofomes roseus]KAH9833756.1 hypothetical protein C8Q71DRAFT_173179 [Rhodofomes roseus]
MARMASPTWTTLWYACTSESRTSTHKWGQITKEYFAKVEDDWSRWRTIREKNNHLRELQLDRRNIVLDSAHPNVAPHIVITPPDSVDAWNNYWATCVNRTGPQEPAQLQLPHRSDGLDPLACFAAPADAEARVHRAAASDNAQNGSDAGLFTEPRRVFSSSRLHSRERELLFLDNISAAVQRRQFRLAAQDAASIAPSFRARWQAPEFAHRFERPFKWTDEAEPLLSYFAHCVDTTVIDSPTPCIAPHIVIQEPPTDEPAPFMASHHNLTPAQQDCYFLTVPASFVHFVNENDSQVWGTETDLGMDMEAEAESITTSCSGSWSEGLATPHGSHYELGEAIIEEFEEYVGEDEEGLRPATPPYHAVAEEPLENLKATVDVFECEEEDELPPFDDWYQNIASRAAT